MSPTTIENVLLNKISMKYNNTVMASFGETAMSALEKAANKYNKQFYLVVEGAIPTAENGRCCVIGELNDVPLTMLDAVKRYAPMAKAVVAAGTCAAFGGISAALPNQTGCMSVKDVLALNSISALVVNLPSCPVHPTVLIQTLVSVILGNIPTLNPDNTPTTFYNTATIHDGCPRFTATKVTSPGVVGCYQNIGCNGPHTNMTTCRISKWNNGVNWCIDSANTPCIGCSNSDFPTNPLNKIG